MNQWAGRPMSEVPFTDVFYTVDNDGEAIAVDRNNVRLLDEDGNRISPSMRSFGVCDNSIADALDIKKEVKTPVPNRKAKRRGTKNR